MLNKVTVNDSTVLGRNWENRPEPTRWRSCSKNTREGRSPIYEATTPRSHGCKIGYVDLFISISTFVMCTGVGGAPAHQVSVEEQRQILMKRQQQEREQELSEQLIRRMQLEENPPVHDEDDVTNDEVSFTNMTLAVWHLLHFWAWEIFEYPYPVYLNFSTLDHWI